MDESLGKEKKRRILKKKKNMALPIKRCSCITNNKRKRSRGWSELPDYILELILSKLTLIDDYIRSGAVCKPWHHVVRDYRPTLPRQLPFLMTRPNGNNQPYIFNNYFNVRRRSCKIELDVPHNSSCIGSLEGWLVFEGEDQDCSSSICLVNPFMSVNNKIFLPPLTQTVTESSSPRITKIVLSAHPTSNSDYMVMAIYGTQQMLAFYKHDAGTWTKIAYDACFDDIIYYKDTFYAVTGMANIMICDLSVFPTMKPINMRTRFGLEGMMKYYLVESSGELLLVKRSIGNGSCTFKFVMLKLDLIKLEATEINNNLRDRILFLGGISGYSVLALDFPSCRSNSNCIYFGFDAFHDQPWEKPFGTGFFSIENGQAKESKRIVPHPIWVEPKLHGFEAMRRFL